MNSATLKGYPARLESINDHEFKLKGHGYQSGSTTLLRQRHGAYSISVTKCHSSSIIMINLFFHLLWRPLKIKSITTFSGWATIDGKMKSYTVCKRTNWKKKCKKDVKNTKSYHPDCNITHSTGQISPPPNTISLLPQATPEELNSEHDYYRSYPSHGEGRIS